MATCIMAPHFLYRIVGNFGEVFNLAINFGEFSIDHRFSLVHVHLIGNGGKDSDCQIKF